MVTWFEAIQSVMPRVDGRLATGLAGGDGEARRVKAAAVVFGVACARPVRLQPIATFRKALQDNRFDYCWAPAPGASFGSGASSCR